jgi:NADPH-dependent 2,4-dienoyl-CoA reductase/sulfur reductase-like enzyme
VRDEASERANRSVRIEPDDRHNRDLVANVHPPAWINPAPAERYDMVVIGAGTAGLVCAAGAAGLGARVALVERHLMGGDCLNFGCVPSKAVLRAAKAWHAAAAGASFGAPIAAGGGDTARAMERMRALRAEISRNDSAERFRRLGVDVFLGVARFAGGDRVSVDGTELRFRRAVIATGARAAVPPIPGLEAVAYRPTRRSSRSRRRPRAWPFSAPGRSGASWRRPSRAWARASRSSTTSRASYRATTPMPRPWSRALSRGTA